MISPSEFLRLIKKEAKLKRWGKDLEPFWVHGEEIIAPPAGSILVSKRISRGKRGYIYGFLISTEEPNSFYLNWTSGGEAFKIRIPFAGKGAVESIDVIALNTGSPCDPNSLVWISNVSDGGEGVPYQASLLIGEV